MKTVEGTYLTHVLRGTQSGQCHLNRPVHLHYLMTSWYLQYTSSGKLTFLNFFTRLKFPIVGLPELTPKYAQLAQFGALLTALRDQPLGSMCVDDVELVINDWYMSSGTLRCVDILRLPGQSGGDG